MKQKKADQLASARSSCDKMIAKLSDELSVINTGPVVGLGEETIERIINRLTAEHSNCSNIFIDISAYAPTEEPIPSQMDDPGLDALLDDLIDLEFSAFMAERQARECCHNLLAELRVSTKP